MINVLLARGKWVLFIDTLNVELIYAHILLFRKTCKTTKTSPCSYRLEFQTLFNGEIYFAKRSVLIFSNKDNTFAIGHMCVIYFAKKLRFSFRKKWQSKANILAQKVTFKQLVRLLSIIISLFSVRE